LSTTRADVHDVVTDVRVAHLRGGAFASVPKR